MPSAPLLTDAEITARLESHPDWRRRGDTIERTLVMDDFRSVVALLVELTGHADEQNHHPDVHISWNELTLVLWTHAAGGLTERDFGLAATIDRLVDH